MLHPCDRSNSIVNLCFELVGISFHRHDTFVETDNLHIRMFIQYSIVSEFG